MKRVNQILIVIALVISAISCKKEANNGGDCSKQCFNGGSLNVSCNCDCPTGFSGSQCETASSPCRINHTATVSFINRSVNSYTYTIYWDNVALTSVGPNSTVTYPTAANVQRHIYAKANGTNIKSSTQILTFQECSENNLTWSF